MDHTNAVYQFVSPRIKFPTKPLSLCRAFGALHGGHSVLPPSLSLCRTSGSGCERFELRYSLFCFVLANCCQPKHYRHQLSCRAVLLWMLSVPCFCERWGQDLNPVFWKIIAQTMWDWEEGVRSVQHSQRRLIIQLSWGECSFSH